MLPKNIKKTILSQLFSLQKLPKKKYWNISWNQGIILSELISLKKPKQILELGTSNGFSTLFLAKSMPKNSHITTIEINSDRIEEAKKNFQNCHLTEKITTIQGNILEILPKLKTKYDFIFMDAAHKHYIQIIQLLKKYNLLTKNATITADNIISHSYMSDFINFMEQKYICQIIKTKSGLLIATPPNQ